MNSLSLEDKVLLKELIVKGNYFYIIDQNGKTHKRHKSISDKLKNASSKDLSLFEIIGNGVGVHWAKFDEDLSAAYLIYPEKF